MVVVAPFTRRKNIQISGGTTSAARINADDSITPWHPYFGIHCFPCEETSRRALQKVGMLFDQPIPHQFVMLLIPHAFAVRTRCHDDRDWILRLWPINISADDKSVVHRNGHVAFD